MLLDQNQQHGSLMQPSQRHSTLQDQSNINMFRQEDVIMVNDMAVKMLSFEQTQRIVEESNTESEEEKSDMSSLFTNKLLLPLHSQA